MNLKNILEKELEMISLSSGEILELRKIAKSFIDSLREKGIRAYVGGSLAKGTLVRKGEYQDVDIFVVFDCSEDILKLEKILKKIKLPGKLKKIHGSRDYFQIDCGSVLLEVVPVMKNKNPESAENVTDVSLKHVKYVRDVIKKSPKLAGEIMLAKAFCRAQRCYGAESYIKGFSGYSLEVLIIHFGGFIKFLKGISKGRSGKKIIDQMKYFKNDN